MERMKKLILDGFSLNENVESRVNSVYYDKDDDEDCWIEITPAHSSKDYVIEYTKNCETIRVETFSKPEDDANAWERSISSQINNSIKELNL